MPLDVHIFLKSLLKKLTPAVGEKHAKNAPSLFFSIQIEFSKLSKIIQLVFEKFYTSEAAVMIK